MWHAQGFWVQAGILLLFTGSFFQKGNKVVVGNKPLGALHIWVGAQTLYFCFMSQVASKYDTSHFFPYFNFVCLLLLYKFIVEYLNKEMIERILEYMRWLLIVTCFLCTLQYFGLSQFFDFIRKDHPSFFEQFNNLVTGFIGNGTHLSGFLATCVPILFLKWRRENFLIIILIFLILTQAGTNKYDPSASGFCVLILISYFYLYFKNRKAFWWAGLVGFISVITLFCIFSETAWFGKFLRPTGRMLLWSYYLPLFKRFAITGTGLGTINEVFKAIGSRGEALGLNARHLHLEYYHFALELGLIGLVLILNLIKEFFNGENEDTTLVLKTIVLGFLISCLFNFPAHLWLPSTYAMFAYASVYAIKNEETLNEYKHIERNQRQRFKNNTAGRYPDWDDGK